MAKRIFAMILAALAVMMLSGGAMALQNAGKPKGKEHAKTTAAGKEQGKGVKGTIKAVGDDSVTIEKKLKSGPADKVFKINAKTNFKNCSGLSDLAVGDRIGIKFLEPKKNEYIALFIMKVTEEEQQAGKIHGSGGPEKAAKTGGADKAAKPGKAAKSGKTGETGKAEKSGKTAKTGKTEKPLKMGKPSKTQKAGKAEESKALKIQKTGKTEKKDKTSKTVKGMN